MGIISTIILCGVAYMIVVMMIEIIININKRK